MMGGLFSGNYPGGTGPAVAPDSTTLLVIGTLSGDRLSQLRAGEAASAVLLQAALAGMSRSPLTRAAGGRPNPCGRRGRGARRHAVTPDGDPRRVALGAGTVPPLTPRRALDEQIER